MVLVFSPVEEKDDKNSLVPNLPIFSSLFQPVSSKKKPRKVQTAFPSLLLATTTTTTHNSFHSELL